MAVKNPKTYGDYWFAKQVEASEIFDEVKEQAFAPFFEAVLDQFSDIEDIPLSLVALMQNLKAPETAGFGGFALGVGVEMIDETLHTLMNPMMKMMGRSINRRALETWLTSTEANTLFRRDKIDRSYWDLITKSEGYETVIGKQKYQAEMPFPSIPDIITYARYHGDPNNPWSAVNDRIDIDAVDFPVWDWLALQRLNTLQIQTLFKRGLIDNTTTNYKLAEAGWRGEDIDYIKQTAWSVPNAMLWVQGNLHSGVGLSEILQNISKADINPLYAQTYLDGILTKPNPQDLIAYELRNDPNLSNLPKMLQRIGIHPEYTDIYKTLAYPIPPVADLITMAVREAFTPSVAAKFGQYQDFPDAFEQFAKMKGLTPEWAKRYWASHWSLPSARQGFEMLHRGVIDFGELDMLLRALDVMPFWRNKLTSIAYRRMTRVDIRRMYKMGVINQSDVLAAYLELGYNQSDAQRMTQFTVLWALPPHASITRSDILTAYKRRMIDRAEASQLLADMGENEFHRGFMLDAVDYKKALEVTDIRIKGIGNLYIEHIYDENKVIEELSKLDLPSDEINLLMEKWYFEIQGQTPRLWTNSQTLGFAKEGLITKDRAKAELKALGYDGEHINIYMESIL
ncbi:hypothetical protein LCGC14_0984150 [marine sediment metagenome]|uniref:Uncharacterized protein n=1 Tax=marine sediment metagenome TaxID=412755 RepID=A0A0F9RED1_9ZZZZ